MTRFLGLLLGSFVFASPAFAQNPTDLSLVLATKGGVTTYRIGELIDLEFRFSSQSPDRYKFADCYYGEKDTFTADPSAGTRDPHNRSYPASISCLTGSPNLIGSNPIAKNQYLNDWIEFGTPGRYRVSATTEQIADVQSHPVHLQSNTIEIEIVAPEPGWAEKQAREAAAVLRAGRINTENISGISVVNIAEEQAAERAARTLEYLGTLDAVAPLVEFFATSRYSNELGYGLRSSPYRKEIISRMRSDLVAPDIAITSSWFHMLLELETTAARTPAGNTTSNSTAADYQRNYDRILSEVSAAAVQKAAPARVVTLQTLLQEGGQNPNESVKGALIASLLASPANVPSNIFENSLWERWASPDAHAAVLAVAKGMGSSRNDALVRLLEFSADEARQIVIERVRSEDYGTMPGLFPGALLMLPDKTLPDLDDLLVSEYEKGNPMAPRLISRYASEKVFPRIRDSYQKRSSKGCDILPYFYRVNPEEAGKLRKESTQNGNPLCTLSFDSFAMSAGLQQAAIEDLESRDPRLQTVALQLLEMGSGNAIVKETLLKAVEEKPVLTPEVNRIVNQLLNQGRWSLTDEEMNRLKVACLNQPCNNLIEARSRLPNSNANVVTISLQGSISIRTIQASTVEDILEAISHFRPGMQFRLSPSPRVQSWVYQQRLEKVHKAFAIAGIPLVEF